MKAKCKMTGEEKVLPCSAYSCPLFGDCITQYGEMVKKTMTNGDRIRTMTDEELAKVVLEVADSGIYIGFCRELPECLASVDDGGVPDEKCLECVKLWLNQPAEEQL